MVQSRTGFPRKTESPFFFYSVDLRFCEKVSEVNLEEKVYESGTVQYYRIDLTGG